MKQLALVCSLVTLAACATDHPVAADGGSNNLAADTGAGPEPDSGNEPDSGSVANDAGSMTDAEVADLGPLDMQTSDVGMDQDTPPDMAGDVGTSGSPETCQTATDATAGGSFVDDTTGGDDDYSAEVSAPGCPSGAVSGPDHVYRLSPQADTTYTLLVEPEASFDPFLYVKSDCWVEACIDGTVLNGAGTQESLTVMLPGGADYFVIVDGELLSEGAYTLTVTPQ